MRVLFWLGVTVVVGGAVAVFSFGRRVEEPRVEEVVRRNNVAPTIEVIAPPPVLVPDMPRPFVPPVEPIVLQADAEPAPRPETLDILKELNLIPGLPRVTTVAATTTPRPEQSEIQQVKMPYAPEDEAKAKTRREAQRELTNWMRQVLAPLQNIPSPLRAWWTGPDTAEESAEPPIAK